MTPSKLYAAQYSLGLVLSLTILAGCASQTDAAKKKGGPGPGPAAPVRVATVLRQDLPYEIQAIGNVEAHSSVAVKSRINGQIDKVHIQDAQDIRAGQLLFEIDPAPFLEQVRLAEANIARDIASEKQAQANVLRDIAQAKTARAQATRYESLMQQGIAAREQAEQMRSTADAAEAAVSANQAAIESSRASLKADESRLHQSQVELSYTKIHAPISGKAGFINVKEGNLVKENDTVSLVSILRVQPIFVSFSVPEQSLGEIRRYMAAGSLSVEAEPPGEHQLTAVGRLAAIDNSVDATTGMIRLKALFTNTDLRLWPGQFTNVRLRLRTDRQVLVMPSKAIQNGPQGTFTWFVKPDMTVEPRNIQVTRASADKSIIQTGLTEGDKVVIEGQLRLTRGARIEITAQAVTSAERSTASEEARR